MSTRRLFWALLPLLAVLSGCQPAKPSASSHDGLNPAGKSVAAQPGDPPIAPGTFELRDTVGRDPHAAADVLADRAKNYAKSMEPKLARLAAAQSGSPLARPGNNLTDPSLVQFTKDPASRPAAPTADATLPTTNPVPSITPTSQPTVTQTPARQDIPFNKDTPVGNAPLIVGQPRPLAATDDVARKFFQQVKDYPQDVAGQLDWQLLQFMQGQSVPQLQTIAPLPAEDREMLSTLLDGLTNFRNALRADNNMLLSRKIRPLVEMSDRLRTQAELNVPPPVLCTDVKGFGVYDPIDPARFEAGKEHKVIVYCEVENFASLLDEQKRWVTKLTQDVVLYTEQSGEEVWHDKVPARAVIDYCRNRRHDFFIVKMIRLPANLTIGRYLLKVTVVDQQVNRVAENTVPLTIVAQ